MTELETLVETGFAPAYISFDPPMPSLGMPGPGMPRLEMPAPTPYSGVLAPVPLPVQQYGALQKEPYVGGVALPASGVELHFHGNSINEIEAGHFKEFVKDEADHKIKLSAYNSTMADHYAVNLGFKRYP